MNSPVRVIHPFHPLFTQELDFVVERPHFGERRVFYRDRDGHLASLPARWTSAVPEDPYVAAGGGRAAFLARDLLELAALLAEVKP